MYGFACFSILFYFEFNLERNVTTKEWEGMYEMADLFLDNNTGEREFDKSSSSKCRETEFAAKDLKPRNKIEHWQ